MNSPSRVIGFVNAGHFIDHYAMLIFAAAVIIMGPALGMAYSELLPYATPGFIAFGAGSLLTGWLGDRWSRRHMMVIFFIGIGASMIAVGFVQTPLQLGGALLAIGIFASIYHPVGTAMIVSYESLDELFDLFNEWDSLIQCEEDAEGFPVGNSLEANTKRLIADATSRTSRLIFQLLIRGMESAPPVDIDDL